MTVLVVAQATSRLTSAHKPTIVFFFEKKVVLWPADEDAMEEELVVEVEAVMVVKQSMPKNFALQGVSSTTNFFQKMTPTKREAKDPNFGIDPILPERPCESQSRECRQT